MFTKLFNTLFNHERYQSISVLITIAFLLYFFGCESKVRSVTNPERKITRSELQLELDTLVSKCEIGFSQLDKQDEIRNLILQQALIAANATSFNPIGLITSLGTVLGIGATVDNVRKRKEIKKIKTTGEIPA